MKKYPYREIQQKHIRKTKFTMAVLLLMRMRREKYNNNKIAS